VDFNWRGAEYFFHNRAAIGLACVQHALKLLPFARTWLLTLRGASPF